MADKQEKKKVDEEWKKKAKEEAEKADQEAITPEAASEAVADTQAAAAEGAPHFEPSFQMLVTNFAMEALISMGAMENPSTKKTEVNLDHAKYAIDMLQIIAEKTKGNLTDQEKKAIEGTLYDLRMRYLQTG